MSERKKYDARNWKLYIISVTSFDASHSFIAQEESEYIQIAEFYYFVSAETYRFSLHASSAYVNAKIL